MQNAKGLRLVLAVLIGIGLLAGARAVYRRFRVETANREVEIALDWAEVWNLAQTNPVDHSLTNLLQKFKEQGVSSLLIGEDTLATLEQNGALHPPARVVLDADHAYTRSEADDAATLERIRAAIVARGWATVMPSHPLSGTVFSLTGSNAPPLYTTVEYANLRGTGVGLPPDALRAARDAGLRIAGRISNFAGVSPVSAGNALQKLYDQGAHIVIFSGDEVLGFRGEEKAVATILGAPVEPTPSSELTPGEEAPEPPPTARVPLFYGAVEFGKQKGDETLSIALKGRYVRVHSIQTAEMGQIDENEAIDRFVRAARERNIRFCFVRLLTFTGSDPVARNVQFLQKITHGIQHGSALTGATLGFAPARPFGDTDIARFWFAIVALAVAAGVVWLLRICWPPAPRLEIALLIVTALVCMGLAYLPGHTGRKLVALLAGIVFPTIACLKTFPRQQAPFAPKDKGACILAALRGLAQASAITALGIVCVIGLLATRPFMVRADQFLGIKAQHAVPLLIVAGFAIVGGIATAGETWMRFRTRLIGRLRELWEQPLQVGLLVLGLVALLTFALIVARTGNEPGVGVSGVELKARAILDRILPVRPRTKEFLVGHPAFVLGLAWWWRGRRKLAVPLLVVGSIGQVSLLNTFCHIHTPLVVSLWRDGIGLVIGAGIGIALFLLGELILKAPSEPVRLASESEENLTPRPPSLPVATAP